MELIVLKLSVTNCFLVKTRNKYILIDTGYEYDWDLFRKRLKEVNIKLSEISHIILTHHHDDHSGLLNKILNENNDIKVVMSYLAPDLLLKGENDRTHGGGLLNKRIKMLVLLKRIKIMLTLKKFISKDSNLKFPPYKLRENDIQVNGDTVLEDIGIMLNGRIIETPGHTIDSISVIFNDGTSIVGDAAANMLQFAGTKYCVIFITDIKEYYKSWREIISSNAQQIYPAHGKPFPVDELKKNIDINRVENMIMG